MEASQKEMASLWEKRKSRGVSEDRKEKGEEGHLELTLGAVLPLSGVTAH